MYVEIPSHIKEHIKFLAGLLTEETDWLTVKKQLLLVLSPRDRKNFSTRDQKTKKHFVYNSFEKQVRKEWFTLTGNILMMPADKMMDGIDKEVYLLLD